MSLDNALRSALLSEGEAIPAETGGALSQISARVRAHRRRRAAETCLAAAALGIVVWAPGARFVERPVDVPPARRDEAPVERRYAPEPDGTRVRTWGTVPADGGRGRKRRDPSQQRVPAGPRRPQREGPPERPAAPPVPKQAPAATITRRLTERYEVSYVSGMHVSENAGAGCWQGESRPGSNDCIPIQLEADESQIALRLKDDAGFPAGATVYQHANGGSSTLAEFCGSTEGFVDAWPGALLLVYIDGTDRCAHDAPHSGLFVARIR